MIKYFGAFVLVLISFRSNSQNLIWAKSFGGYATDGGNAIVTDASGNVYATGYFQGAVDFDPSPATSTLSSLGLNDIFITKFDGSGNFVWAKTIGGASNDEGLSIAVDVFGSVYVVGFFNATVDFDPGTGSFPFNSYGGKDGFILKLDGAGNFIWAQQIGASLDDIGEGISIDASGDVVLAGSFQSIVDFNAGAPIDTLTSFGQSDIFIAKYHANGNYVWAKKMGGALTESVSAMTVDGGSNIFVTGTFEGGPDFDTGTNTYTLTAFGKDIFIAKIDAFGNFFWAKQIGGSALGNNLVNSIAADGSGNIFTTGSFNATTDFDPSLAVVNLSATALSDDVFILKLNSLGNFVWVKQIASPAAESGNGIDIDPAGNVYTIGSFLGSVDFDPSASSHFISSSSPSKTDAFILKLTSAGNFVWTAALGGIESDVGNKIKIDASGTIYSIGVFQSNADMDPGASIQYVTSNGNYDVFIHKMNPAINPTATSFSEGETVDDIRVYPNPTEGILTIRSEQTIDYFEIYDVNCKLLVSENNSTQINLKNYNSGIYFLKVVCKNNTSFTKKILKE